jgi:hypothetical protein
MRYLLTLCATALPALAAAQVTHQSATISPEGEERVVRHVILKDEQGMDTLVEQHLIELENGDYLYLHGSQPQATQELDERICASFGANVSKGSVVRLSPETLGGGSCHTEVPLEPSTSANAATRAPYLSAIAPGNYVVPVNQNSVHRGTSSYRLDSPGTVSSDVVVDSRCRGSASDPTPGGVSGSSDVYVSCFMPMAGTAPTRMATCAGGQCAHDAKSFNVF